MTGLVCRASQELSAESFGREDILPHTLGSFVQGYRSQSLLVRSHARRLVADLMQSPLAAHCSAASSVRSTYARLLGKSGRCTWHRLCRRAVASLLLTLSEVRRRRPRDHPVAVLKLHTRWRQYPPPLLHQEQRPLLSKACTVISSRPLGSSAQKVKSKVVPMRSLAWCVSLHTTRGSSCSSRIWFGA